MREINIRDMEFTEFRLSKRIDLTADLFKMYLSYSVYG